MRGSFSLQWMLEQEQKEQAWEREQEAQYAANCENKYAIAMITRNRRPTKHN